MKSFNASFGLRITIMVSSMYAFYVLCIYGLLPLIWPQYTNEFLYWSNYMQLIFLPALAVGSAIMAQRHEDRDKAHQAEIEKRDLETHDEVIKMHKEAHEKMDRILAAVEENRHD